jgi:hypothetical protein
VLGFGTESLSLYVLFALGLSFTGAKFHSAQKLSTYRDYPKSDGAARYDDVWGG